MNETQVLEIIKAGKVVVKIWDDGCKFCTEYAPIFDKVADEVRDHIFVSLKIPRNAPSEFRKTYLQDKPTVPATLLFHDGVVKASHFGRMYPDQLKAFISGQPMNKSPIEWAAGASYDELITASQKLSNEISEAQFALKGFEAEIKARQARMFKLGGACDKSLKSFFSKEAWLNPCRFCLKVRYAILGVLVGTIVFVVTR